VYTRGAAKKTTRRRGGDLLGRQMPGPGPMDRPTPDEPPSENVQRATAIMNVLALSPSNGVAYLQAGAGLERMSQLRQSADVLRTAVRLLPQHAKAYDRLGVVLYKAAMRVEWSVFRDQPGLQQPPDRLPGDEDACWRAAEPNCFEIQHYGPQQLHMAEADFLRRVEKSKTDTRAVLLLGRALRNCSVTASVPQPLSKAPRWWRQFSSAWPPEADAPGSRLRCAFGTSPRAAQGPLTGCGRPCARAQVSRRLSAFERAGAVHPSRPAQGDAVPDTRARAPGGRQPTTNPTTNPNPNPTTNPNPNPDPDPDPNQVGGSPALYRRALQLDPTQGDVYLWHGDALHKLRYYKQVARTVRTLVPASSSSSGSNLTVYLTVP
jgi:hypothetical protein